MNTSPVSSRNSLSPVRLFIALLMFGMISLSARTADAGLTSYKLTQAIASKIDASSGTRIWQSYGSGSRYNYGDWTGSQTPFDQASGLYTLPFTFTLDGVAYTQLRVYMSGMITLGSGQIGATYNNSLTSGSSSMPVIAPFWEDLHITGDGSGCWNPYVSYVSTGTAPNRVFTVQWNDLEAAYQGVYGTYYGVGNRVSFQVQIHESGKIVFYYDKMEWQPTCGGWYGNSFTNAITGSIGISAGGANFLSVTPTATATVSYTSADNKVNLQSPAIGQGTNYTFVKVPDIRMSTTPKIIDYGTVSAGAFVDANVVVKHVGTEGVLSVLATTITGLGSSQFSVVSTTGPLNPGQTGNVVVRFTPTLNGQHLATLTISSNGNDSGSQQILLSARAIAPTIQIIPIGDINTPTRMYKKTRTMVGDSLVQSFLVKNIGAGTLVVNPSSNITGEFAPHYKITRWPKLIGADLTDTMSITFSPTQDGGLPARANIVNNGTNGTQYIDLFGVGVVPAIQLTPGEMLKYDSVAMSATVCKTVRISNPGTDTLRIMKDYLSSSDGDFSYTPLPWVNGQAPKIAPGAFVDVNVCITPLQKGTRRARLRLTTNIPLTFEGSGGTGNPDGTIFGSQGQQAWIRNDTSSKTVEIWANVVPSDKSIIAMGDFSDAVIGTESNSVVTMTNEGSEPITVEAPVFSGVNANSFKATKANFPLTVAPGANITFTVVATPSLRGENTAVMNITNKSEDRQYVQAVNLNVKGLLASSSVNETALSFEKLYLGEESSKTVTVANTGDVDQVYTATLVGSGFTLTSDAVSGAVAPGSSAVYTLKFAPTLKGSASGTVTFKSSHIADMSVALTGTADEKPVVQSVKGDVAKNGFVLSQNAPNPATGKTSFTFATPTTSDVHITLVDMTGKTVRELANGVYGAGEHTVNMITGDIASGSYLYILESEGVRLVRQMVITK